MGPFAAFAVYLVASFGVAGVLAWKDHPAYALTVVVVSLLASPRAKQGGGEVSSD